MKYTITIGIPAFNEEKNIKLIIKDILRQKDDNYKINKIIVLSDGSTDNTAKIVRNIKSKKILLIANKIRRGKWFAENEIILRSESQILVLLDADIKITDQLFISKLIKPISNGADLTACQSFPLTPHNKLSKALYQCLIFQNNVNAKFNVGCNVYTCRGTARAFSKAFYKTLYIIPTAGEDAYTYFYCLKNGFKYQYAEGAVCYFQLPANLQDHIKQSLRFSESKTKMKEIFGEKLIKDNYNIPKKLFIIEFTKSFIKSPIFFSSYVLINIYTRLLKFKNYEDTVLWNISKSTKNLS